MLPLDSVISVKAEIRNNSNSSKFWAEFRIVTLKKKYFNVTHCGCQSGINYVIMGM